MLSLMNSIVNNTEGLKREVAEIIVDMLSENADNEEVMGTIENITTYGCVSGTVPALTYYSDTEAFFDRHSDECLEIANNYIDMCDGRVTFELTRNNLAWLAFETVANNILAILSE